MREHLLTPIPIIQQAMAGKLSPQAGVSQMEGWKLRVWRHASPRRTGVEKSYP